MSLVRQLETLTPSQRSDLDRMIGQMQHRLEGVRVAPSEVKRREAGEWVLRIAADIYAWSH
jgi:hypothetical protein